MSRADEPAYPSHGTMGEVVQTGLTVREEFAKAAMQGLLASETLDYHASSNESLARHAVSKADALLAELAKPVTP